MGIKQIFQLKYYKPQVSFSFFPFFISKKCWCYHMSSPFFFFLFFSFLWIAWLGGFKSLVSGKGVNPTTLGTQWKSKGKNTLLSKVLGIQSTWNGMPAPVWMWQDIIVDSALLLLLLLSTSLRYLAVQEIIWHASCPVKSWPICRNTTNRCN